GLERAADEVEPLTVAWEQSGNYEVKVLTEASQTDPELLTQFAAAGIQHGGVLAAESSEGYVARGTIDSRPQLHGHAEDFSDVGLEISEDTAAHVRVVRVK